MTRPQFSRARRPLRPASYRAAAKRFRRLADLIERYADQASQAKGSELAKAVRAVARAAAGLAARLQDN